MVKRKDEAPRKHLPSGETLLTAAAFQCNTDALDLFLRRAVEINATNKSGSTALHVAAMKGHLRIVEILVDHGADLELLDRLGMPALHLACVHGHLEVVDLFLKLGCCANGSRHPEVSSPIMMTMGINDDIVLLLLKYGADMNKRQSYGNNALSRAVASGNVALIEQMLAVAKPDFCHTNDSGYNIFHSICKFRHCLPGEDEMQHCEILRLLTTFADKADFGKALTEAMPSFIRSNCLTCYNIALPHIDIHHKYDNAGTDILQHAMSSDHSWHATGPKWSYRGGSCYGLTGTRIEMVHTLLNAGASLLTTKRNVIGNLYGMIQSTPCHVLDMYLIYIKAWGGWYPNHAESSHMFRKFGLQIELDQATWLVCLAGYTPDEIDLRVLGNKRPDSSNDLVQSLRETFTANPRSLANSASVCVRQCLWDNVFYKVKLLKLPRTLENLITLENAVVSNAE